MNPKHTPTPWNTPAVTINDASKKIIAICTDRSNEENKANAAFIVRAVNSYAELLEMLKKLTNKIDKHFYSLPEGNENEGKEWKRLYEMSCEAIAKAEGKS